MRFKISQEKLKSLAQDVNATLVGYFENTGIVVINGITYTADLDSTTLANIKSNPKVVEIYEIKE